MTSVVLASKSSARSALLRAAGVAFEVVDSEVAEAPLKAAWLEAGRTPKAVAEGLACAKALAVARTRPGLVIGADQTLEFDGRLIDKPADKREARSRLIALRGQAHALHSAVALARDGVVKWRDVETSVLHVRDFTDSWLNGYLAEVDDAVLASVGAYQLEGLGVQLFERIDGDWFAILGLPMLGLLAALRREGALAS